MTTEDRLRAAIRTRTEAVEPGSDGWDRIEEKIESGSKRGRPGAFFLVTAAAAVVAGVVLAAALLTTEDDSTDVEVVPPAQAPTSVTELEIEEPSRTIWPPEGTSRAFDDPVALANFFAREYLGIRDPALGAFEPASPEAGRVLVRPSAASYLTTAVSVQSARPGWVVTDVRSGDVILDGPTALSAISSPVVLAGRARAFEGTVQVAVLEDGQSVAEGPRLGTGFVTGASDVLGPFTAELPFTRPSKPAGVIALWTESAEDGSVQQATVVRVRFPQPPETFLATTRDGRVVLYSTADSKEVSSLAMPGARRLAMAADGTAYVERRVSDCKSEIMEVKGHDRLAARVITEGRSPAVSREGSQLAYTRSRSGGSACKQDEIVVRDLATHDERTWTDPRAGAGAIHITNLALSPGGAKLALEVESGDAVHIREVFTQVHRSLADARAGVGQPGHTYRLPGYTGSLHGYRDGASASTPGAVVDLFENGDATVFEPGVALTSLDVNDTAGHYLFVDEKGVLSRWAVGGTVQRLASGIVDADW